MYVLAYIISDEKHPTHFSYMCDILACPFNCKTCSYTSDATKSLSTCSSCFYRYALTPAPESVCKGM